MQHPSYSAVVQYSWVSSPVRSQVDLAKLTRHTASNMSKLFSFSKKSATATAINDKSDEYIWSSIDEETNTTVESTVSLPKHVEDDQRVFHAQFSQEAAIMLGNLRARFPFRHVIHWTLYISDQCQHVLDIDVKPPT
ncbi:unnamed protein product [Didymodactylos carnosus]|uniref:Uncharacterized protein n=1 Tax=Didymodactylos carnosus TaxID=1234261 RepID=A0A814ZLK4_9BILA|nr:unnamed protein product [Didymodactylos carnosus]CAF1245254.1 unnamed protein product [Didymodactylos carnosus]CAF3810757.1 unnamed protein product [Didymodactylos carnosus]CAF4010932.1 unnamed protein product [Didymodactylos carnosus]